MNISNSGPSSYWVSERHLKLSDFMKSVVPNRENISHILVPSDLSQTNREILSNTFKITDLHEHSEFPEKDYRILIVMNKIKI